MVDFFISRAGEDLEIASIVDTILRDAGFTTFIQDRDFGYSDFTEKMDDGFRLVEDGTTIIALVSSAYLAKPHCMKEARYPLIEDPGNKYQKLIVFRIEDVRPTGFLKALRYVDLFPHLRDKPKLASVIIDAIGSAGHSSPNPCADRANYPLATDADFKSERVNKALLLLELEDEENNESGLNWLCLATVVVAGLLIAFDYGIEFWNRVFDTSYYAIFDTTSVIFFAIIALGFIFFSFFSHMKNIASNIGALKLSPGELRALRKLVAAREWKSKTIISAAMKSAIRSIATQSR
jgi:hypothetical protein